MTAKWVGADGAEYVSVGGAPVTTDALTFRTAYTDCSLKASGVTYGHLNFMPYAETDFWFSGRMCSNFNQNNNANTILLEFYDDTLNPRLKIVGLGGVFWKVQKVGSGGVTDIGNTFFYPMALANGHGDKIDVHVNYDVAGSVDIYINLVHVFAFLGDCTTDGVSALSYHRLGGLGLNANYWSETWIDDEDTRAQSLASWRPLAPGNANTFDATSTGGAPAAANINEIFLDVTTLNGAASAGLIDQYTNGAPPSNTLDVKALVISAYAQRGTSGPSKIALGVRTGGSDYWGADQALDISWQNVQEVFAINPNTGVPWLKAQIGNASGFNIGAKSAT